MMKIERLALILLFGILGAHKFVDKDIFQGITYGMWVHLAVLFWMLDVPDIVNLLVSGAWALTTFILCLIDAVRLINK